MIGPLKSMRTPIGIDVGARYVKAVQLSRSIQAPRIEAAARFPRLSPAGDLDGQEVRHVCEVLRRQGFRRNQAVLAVPDEKLLTASMELPPRSSGAPVGEIARSELARIHGCDGESLEVSHWDLPSPARSSATHVMAVACPHDQADAYLDILAGHGLDVVGLDFPAHAIAQAISPAASSTDGMAAALEIGWTQARLLLMHQGVVVYERILGECGNKRLTDVIGRRLELDPDQVDDLLAELGRSGSKDTRKGPSPFAGVHRAVAAHADAIAEELRNPFSYASRQYPDTAVGSLFVLGDGASVPGLAERLARHLNVQTRVLAASDLAVPAPNLADSCSDPALVTALGLAQFQDV